MNETIYWQIQVDHFIVNTLKKERAEDVSLASYIDDEIEIVRHRTERFLEEDPEKFVIFLYVEHELNKSDPLGCAYPSIMDEYSRYAWYIVDIYKTINKENFYKQLPKYLEGIWDSVHNNDRNRSLQISRTANNIMNVIDEVCPSTATQWFEKAHDHVNKQQYYEAIFAYSKGINLNLTCEKAYENRGDIYLESYQYDLAISDYSKLIALNPQNAMAYYHRAKIFEFKCQCDLAISDYSKAIELDPNVDEFGCRGFAYYNNGQYDLAIRDFSKLIAECHPTDTGYIRPRADAYYATGRYELAIADFSTLVELDLDSSKYYYDRGLAYYFTGQYDLAMSDFSKMIEIDPQGAANAYYCRGLVHKAKGQNDLGNDDHNIISTLAGLFLGDFSNMSALNQIIELNPQDATAYMKRGEAYRSQRQYDLALRDFNKMIELNPKDPMPHNSRGLVYESKSQAYLALRDFSVAIELNSQYADAYVNRGRTYYNKGEYTLALIDCDKALDLKPQNSSEVKDVQYLCNSEISKYMK